MKFANSFAPDFNLALDRPIAAGLKRFQPVFNDLRSQIKERNTPPLIAALCLCAIVIGWLLG